MIHLHLEWEQEDAQCGVGWSLVPWTLLPVFAESRQAQTTVLCTVEILWTFSVLSPPHLWVIRRGWMAELARSVPALLVLFLTGEKMAGAGQMGQGIKDLGWGNAYIKIIGWLTWVGNVEGRKETNTLIYFSSFLILSFLRKVFLLPCMVCHCDFDSLSCSAKRWLLVNLNHLFKSVLK